MKYSGTQVWLGGQSPNSMAVASWENSRTTWDVIHYHVFLPEGIHLQLDMIGMYKIDS